MEHSHKSNNIRKRKYNELYVSIVLNRQPKKTEKTIKIKNIPDMLNIKLDLFGCDIFDSRVYLKTLKSVDDIRKVEINKNEINRIREEYILFRNK